MQRDFSVSRRGFLAGSAAGLALTTEFGGALSIRALGADRTAVNLQLGWLIDGSQIGQVAALRKGFYDEEGLDFSLSPGGPNIDGVALVAAGRNNVGLHAGSSGIMVAVGQEIPIRCFAAGLQDHPWSLVSLTKNPIKTPADLKGKRVGVQPTSRVLLDAVLLNNGLTEQDVQITPVGNDVAPLTTGQVDAMPIWQTTISALEAIGPDRVSLTLADAGVQIYGNCYYTNVTYLKDNTDVLERFLRATARGWAYVRAHRDEAVRLLVAENPNLDSDQERKGVDVMLDYSFGPSTDANGWGYMDPKLWQSQLDTYQKLNQFPNKVPTLAEVADFGILDATRDARLAAGKTV